MAGTVVAGLAVSGSFDCASQGRDAPLRMTMSKGRAMMDDAVRLVCLRMRRLASEPTAKVTAAPMRTYQVHATLGTVRPAKWTGVGCSHRAMFSTKPVIMPRIVPHWVAYRVSVPNRKTPSRQPDRKSV